MLKLEKSGYGIVQTSAPGPFTSVVLSQSQLEVQWDLMTFQGQAVTLMSIWTEPNEASCSNEEVCKIELDVTTWGTMSAIIADLIPGRG